MTTAQLTATRHRSAIDAACAPIVRAYAAGAIPLHVAEHQILDKCLRAICLRPATPNGIPVNREEWDAARAAAGDILDRYAMLSQTDNRRLRHARESLDGARNRLLIHYPLSNLARFTWYHDQQSARIARRWCLTSFAGVPASYAVWG